jgi:GTPase SAR1 family protein
MVFRVAKAFILVFDITSAASFKHISNIITEIKSVKKIDDLHSVPIVLVGYDLFSIYRYQY